VFDLANIGHSTPWDFSSSIMDFIGSKDFSFSSLGLGYATLSPQVKRNSDGDIQRGKIREAEVAI
jgi:hypothetical protein